MGGISVTPDWCEIFSVKCELVIIFIVIAMPRLIRYTHNSQSFFIIYTSHQAELCPCHVVHFYADVTKMSQKRNTFHNNVAYIHVPWNVYLYMAGISILPRFGQFFLKFVSRSFQKEYQSRHV